MYCPINDTHDGVYLTCEDGPSRTLPEQNTPGKLHRSIELGCGPLTGTLEDLGMHGEYKGHVRHQRVAVLVNQGYVNSVL